MTAAIMDKVEPRVMRATESSRDMAFHYVVEAIGTLALLFMGISSIVMTGNSNIVAIALAHGLAIALMVAATGHISGGAFNPAVVVALWLARRITLQKGIAYIIAQLIGATIGTLLVAVVFPRQLIEAVGWGTPGLGQGVTALNGLAAEIISTFFLTYVFFGVAVDKRGPSPIASLMIGLAIVMGILATGAVSGAAMNPARWFGPAILAGRFENLWVWWVGPFVGASIAGLLYFYGYLRVRALVD
jgi:aquaporin TIP